MAKYLGPVCRLCRREGEKLFLKGQRCYGPKCAFERRGFAPGAHGKSGPSGRSDRESDYARQLRAKQKARRVFGVMERQFRRYFSAALHRRGLTGLTLLQVLECRLDNVVYRMGLADSRSQARQIVNHGHFMVNGIRSTTPSMVLRPGDVISIHETSRGTVYAKQLPEMSEQRMCAVWLDRDLKNLTGRVVRLPERSEMDANLNEQLIVEFYSR